MKYRQHGQYVEKLVRQPKTSKTTRQEKKLVDE